MSVYKVIFLGAMNDSSRYKNGVVVVVVVVVISKKKFHPAAF